MLPADRQRQILALIKDKGVVSVRELIDRFRVSHMTIHRDLDRLATEGQLRKVRGGAINVAGIESPTTADVITICCVCEKKTRRHIQVLLTLKDGTRRVACCAHCALMFLAYYEEEVATALVSDFLDSATVSARAAYFLIAPDLTVCCTPTVLPFARREDAERFQLGFGGECTVYAAARQFIREAMHMEPQVARQDTP